VTVTSQESEVQIDWRISTTRPAACLLGATGKAWERSPVAVSISAQEFAHGFQNTDEFQRQRPWPKATVRPSPRLYAASPAVQVGPGGACWPWPETRWPAKAALRRAKGMCRWSIAVSLGFPWEQERPRKGRGLCVYEPRPKPQFQRRGHHRRLHQDGRTAPADGAARAIDGEYTGQARRLRSGPSLPEVDIDQLD